MKKYFLATLFCACSIFAASPTKEIAKAQEELALEPGACHLPSPKNWVMVDPKVLAPEVKVMVKGSPKKDSNLSPSLNLALEETEMTQEEYLEVVKEMNSQDRNKKFSKLGTLKSKAGTMGLIQLDCTTHWGEVRMLQAIMVKNGIAYVITATAQLEEFTKFSNEFFSCMQAFEINPSINELCGKDAQEKLRLMQSGLHKDWNDYFAKIEKENPKVNKKELANLTFKNAEFQEKVWKPLVSKIQTDYKALGNKWQEKTLKKLKEELCLT